MPKYFRKKKFRKRRFRRRKPKSIYKKANRAYYTAMRLKQIVHPEWKQRFQNINLSPTDQLWSMVLLNGLTHGNDNATREGATVRWKSIQAKLRCTINASATNTLMRIMFVIDKQPNGAAFAPDTQLLQGSTFPESLRNPDFMKRFVVLKDYRIQLRSLDRTAVPLNYYRKINVATLYASNLGTVSDMSTNSIYMIACSNETTIGNPPQLLGSIQLRFLDN